MTGDQRPMLSYRWGVLAMHVAPRISLLPSLVLLDVLLVAETATAAPAGLQADPDPMLVGGAIRINEVRIDQNGVADPDEYFELSGPPGTSLDGLSYIVLGDDPTGTIEAVVNLNGQVIPASGLFVAGEATLSLAVPNMVTTLDFENADVVTHMLVTDFSGTLGSNLDPEADGVLNSTPWSAIVDVIVILGPAGELPYGPGSTCVAGPNCQTVDPPGSPGQVFRCNDGVGAFFFLLGSLDITAVPSPDTPGQLNHCSCGDGIVVLDETCDTMGQSAACDDDCSPVECGDGNVNEADGEQCDDMGESATCNADCSPAMCSDGKVNMTAGEECDDFGESATCDDDCSLVLCGDGAFNATAGEQCDGDGMGLGGETFDCDSDCSSAMCGDGVLNATAGEQCDGDGMGLGGETAACNLDCSVAQCGDFIVNVAAGEDCDQGGPTLICKADCTWETCANSMIDPGEDCDEGGIDTPTCDADCTSIECGDDVLNIAAGELCEHGMGLGGESPSCNSDCTPSVCGDGVLNVTGLEACDTLGESASCDEDCTLVLCGDGVVNFTAGEECDDGNVADGDSCTSSCTEPPVDVSGGGSGGGSGGLNLFIGWGCRLGNPQSLVWATLALLLFWRTDRNRGGAVRGRTRRPKARRP